MKRHDVVVVGATGLVGRKILQVMEERRFPIGRLLAVAGSRSAGTELRFGRDTFKAVKLDARCFIPGSVTFFAAGGQVSREWAPVAAGHAAIVIDNSSEFRMTDDVPLVIPEINPAAVFGGSRIIANPNCSTIQMLLPLKPLHDAFRIRRIVVATYQAVSGAGRRGMLQLESETAGAETADPAFPHPIASNALPHIAPFGEDGYSREERKMVEETRKILGDHDIQVSPTCVRIPVMYCHSEAVNVQFERQFNMDDARAMIAAAPGVILRDDPAAAVYPLASDAADRDEVFVGRLRRDESVENGLSLWIVSDNLRKGAATNAVQIAETWLRGPGVRDADKPQ